MPKSPAVGHKWPLPKESDAHRFTIALFVAGGEDHPGQINAELCGVNSSDHFGAVATIGFFPKSAPKRNYNAFAAGVVHADSGEPKANLQRVKPNRTSSEININNKLNPRALTQYGQVRPDQNFAYARHAVTTPPRSHHAPLPIWRRTLPITSSGSWGT